MKLEFLIHSTSPFWLWLASSSMLISNGLVSSGACGMVDCYVPNEKKAGFCFHATELFSGGKTFNRGAWPREKRWPILREICELPSRFGLPIVVSHITRAEFVQNHPLSSPEVTVQAQMVASAACAITVERYMREKVKSNEVALLIHENNPQAGAWLRGMHNLLRTREGLLPFAGLDEFSKFLPLKRIVDTVYFAAKTDSSILQLADACAFACKRKLMGTKEADYFFEPLRPNFV